METTYAIQWLWNGRHDRGPIGEYDFMSIAIAEAEAVLALIDPKKLSHKLVPI